MSGRAASRERQRPLGEQRHLLERRRRHGRGALDGHGEHVGELTGKKIDVSAISIHRMADGKIAATWEVWDTLGLLEQIGVVAPME
jgi:ketosteroid isomerase-like protein